MYWFRRFRIQDLKQSKIHIQDFLSAPSILLVLFDFYCLCSIFLWIFSLYRLKPCRIRAISQRVMTPSTVFSMTMCELQGLAARLQWPSSMQAREKERERQGARDVTKCSVKTCSRLTAARCRAQGQPSRLSPREARRLQTKKQSGLESRAVVGLWTGQWAGQSLELSRE